MAQSRIFAVTAKKIKLQNGKETVFEDPYQDILVSAQEYVVIPSGADDSLIITASGIEITIEKSLSAIQTSLSGTDATGT